MLRGPPNCGPFHRRWAHLSHPEFDSLLLGLLARLPLARRPPRTPTPDEVWSRAGHWAAAAGWAVQTAARRLVAPLTRRRPEGAPRLRWPAVAGVHGIPPAW